MMETDSGDDLTVMDPAAMLKSLGNQDAFETMINSLETCLIDHLIAIKVALEEHDNKSLGIELQALKGVTLYAHCSRLEKAVDVLIKNTADQNSSKRLAYDYPAFIKECVVLRQFIRKYLCIRGGSVLLTRSASPDYGEEGDVLDLPICDDFEIVRSKETFAVLPAGEIHAGDELVRDDDEVQETEGAKSAEEERHGLVESEQKPTGCYCTIIQIDVLQAETNGSDSHCVADFGTGSYIDANSDFDVSSAQGSDFGVTCTLWIH